QTEQVLRQVIGITEGLVLCIDGAQKRPGCTNAIVVFRLLDYLAINQWTGANASIVTQENGGSRVIGKCSLTHLIGCRPRRRSRQWNDGGASAHVVRLSFVRIACTGRNVCVLILPVNGLYHLVICLRPIVVLGLDFAIWKDRVVCCVSVDGVI